MGKVILIIAMALFLGACGEENERQTSDWGVEEPYVTANNEAFMFSEKNKLTVSEINLSDKIKFNEKYDNKDIKLKIVSTCEGFVQIFSTQVKSNIYFNEILPRQVLLRVIQDKYKNLSTKCTFMFEAQNNKNQKHQFKIGLLNINLKELQAKYKKYLPFTVQKYEIAIDKYSNPPKNNLLNLFSNQIYINNKVGEVNYSLVCADTLLKLEVDSENRIIDIRRNITNKLKSEISNCIMYGEKNNVYYASKEFVIKYEPQDLIFEITEPKIQQNIGYGKSFNGGQIQIENKSNQAVNISISKKDLSAKLFLQFHVHKKHRLTRYISRIQTLLYLAPVGFENKLLKVDDENYYFTVGPKDLLSLDLNYQFENLKYYKENKMVCNLSINSNIEAYEVSWPAEVNINYLTKHQSTQMNKNILKTNSIMSVTKKIAGGTKLRVAGCSKKSLFKDYTRQRLESEKYKVKIF